MGKFDQEKRQQLGCGWESRPALVKIRPWSPVSMDPTWKGSIDTCPGYTTSLPEVIEIARARVHWEEGGGLRDFCDGPPSDAIRLGVEILKGASNECTRWSLDHPHKEAG